VPENIQAAVAEAVPVGISVRVLLDRLNDRVAALKDLSEYSDKSFYLQDIFIRIFFILADKY
jgi:hypothetical protein